MTSTILISPLFSDFSKVGLTSRSSCPLSRPDTLTPVTPGGMSGNISIIKSSFPATPTLPVPGRTG
ncbi:hypothetical protein MAHJHV58_09390 [Mycobacterium avium subsp. hominissuis]